MKKVVAVLLMAAMLGLAGCSSMGYGGSSAAAPAKVVDGVLTNSAGMTLYTFDKDAAGSGKSECNGACATNWPPLLATGDSKAAGDYTNSRAVIDACRPWQWRDKFPKVNVPTPEERRMAQEKFGHLFKD